MINLFLLLGYILNFGIYCGGCWKNVRIRNLGRSQSLHCSIQVRSIQYLQSCRWNEKEGMAHVSSTISYMVSHGHLMTAFFKNIPNNWPIWTDGPNELWGNSSLTLSQDIHFVIVVLFPLFSVNQPIFIQKAKHLRLFIEVGLAKDY